MSSELRASLSIAQNDFAIWRRRPVAIFSTFVPAMMYVVTVYYVSVVVGTPPIALVAGAHTPAATRFESALRSSGGFRVQSVSATRAGAELRTLDVAAILWLNRAPAPHTGLRVTAELDNINEDITDDVRRSLALAIRDFAHQQDASSTVAVSERDTHAREPTLAQFRMVPGLILILTIAGIVNTGLATCQEFENKTFKQLALAPLHPLTLVAGKILGGWLTTIFVGTLMWAVGVATGLLVPHGSGWFGAIALTLVVGLAAASIGVTTGAVLRKFQLVNSSSIAISLYLFFLAGGVSVLAFLPRPLRTAAEYDPLRYAISGLQHLVQDNSERGVPFDVLVVALLAAAGAGISTWALARARTAESTVV